ncbi:hypothetical protein I544_0671 [Mycobacteroides abscessus subsp. bolletii 103]|nr:hypothetical protein L835_0951 [Mycobacteroides abscessus MAB_110811_1470]EUA79383.1 hypothetical protein I544_0671 [Mycobacteroides abscessus subsp. bolletii 103]
MFEVLGRMLTHEVDVIGHYGRPLPGRGQCPGSVSASP